MNTDLIEALNKLRKPCFKVTPVATEVNAENYSQTRFGGIEYSEPHTKAPVCSACNSGLSFVFQFRQRYSEEMKGLGPLYVVYYCFNCIPFGGKDEEGQWKIIAFERPSASYTCHQNDASQHQFKPCVGSIEIVTMLPDYETIEDQLPHIAEMCDAIDDADPSDVYEEAGESIGCEMEPFSSIGGYPLWIQGPVENFCPVCKKEMAFVCQIDSEEEAGLAWGDAGCLYIFQCLEHLDEFAIEMQCF